jgi:hypothetical protein
MVGAAVALGELHQAVADHLSPHQDEVWPQTDTLAAAGLLLGRCVYRSSLLMGFLRDGCRTAPSDKLTPGARETEALLRQAADTVERAAASQPCGPLEVRSPEGYAFYALFPEMYFSSLHRALQFEQPRDRCVVIGIRTIGSSLAPLVAGALVERGFEAHVETVRPGGCPFERQVSAGPRLVSRLQKWVAGGAGFIVVDEGPGLSCSSLLSVYSLLEGMGVEENRLAILASWRGAPGRHAPPELRARWGRARVYHTAASEVFDGWRSLVPFMEQAVARGDGESRPVRLELVEDLSYGRWMVHLYPSRESHPPVNRRTERVKLLLRVREAGSATNGIYALSEPGGGAAKRGGQQSLPSLRESAATPAVTPVEPHGMPDEPILVVAKFAGLGEHGEERFRRATALASAGFSPEVLAHSYGFLVYRFVPGRPLNRSDLSPSLLSRMVDYYVYLARSFSVPPEARFDQLAETITVNARKGPGVDASAFVRRWRSERETIDRLPLALLDGRPQPHEWIEVSVEGEPVVLKTDSADHAEDHTIVGEQSILWDLAGSWEEWRMSLEVGREMLRLWEARTGDSGAARLVDFYRVAYLAFRLGGIHYAMEDERDDVLRSTLEDESKSCADRMLRLLRESSPGHRPTTDGGEASTA